jgi:hypothetical protein
MKESETIVGYFLPKGQRKAVEIPKFYGEVEHPSSGKSIVIDSLQELENCAAANPTMQNALDELYQFSNEQVGLMQGAGSPFIRLEDGKVIVVGLENSVEDTMERLGSLYENDDTSVTVTGTRVVVAGPGADMLGMRQALMQLASRPSQEDGSVRIQDDLDRMLHIKESVMKDLPIVNRAQRRAEAKRQRRNRW